MFDEKRILEQLKDIFDEKTALRLTQVFASVFEPLYPLTHFNNRFDSIDRTLDRAATIAEGTEARLAALTERVDGLAKAQARTEAGLEALGRRVDALAEAQIRTEGVLTGMGIEMKKMRQELGGLSHTVGYDLENRAYVSLPALLKERFDIVVEEPLYRRFVEDSEGNPLEINVIGRATRGPERLRIVGEAKSQLSKNAIEEFIRKRLNRLPVDDLVPFPLLITHMISEPDAEEFARGHGIALVYSYEL